MESPISLSDFSLFSIHKATDIVWDFILTTNDSTIHSQKTEIMLGLEDLKFLSHNTDLQH